jgi:hypothetical protein
MEACIMAGMINSGNPPGETFKGLASIFEFTNGDGKFVRTNCGQAAAATFLTFHGKFELAKDEPCGIMAAIEDRDPPDNFGGAFGTSRRRVARICRRHGIRLREVAGEDAIRDELSNGRPVIVMLGVSGGHLFNRFELPGGHWMVAYGFDADYVYLTNHGSMTWDEFRRGWASFVPRLISMRGKGLVADLAEPDA